MSEKKKYSFKSWVILAMIALTLWVLIQYLNCNQKMKPNTEKNDAKIDSLIAVIHKQETIVDDLKAKIYNYTDSMNHANSGLRNQIAALTLALSSSGSDTVRIYQKKDTIFDNRLDTFYLVNNEDYFDFFDSTEFLKLDGKIDLKNKLLSYDYTYKADYTVLASYYKDSFLKKPVLMVRILSNDKNAKVDAELFQFKAKQPLFDVGLGIGYGLSYNNKKIHFSPSIQISIYKKLFSIYR